MIFCTSEAIRSMSVALLHKLVHSWTHVRTLGANSYHVCRVCGLRRVQQDRYFKSEVDWTWIMTGEWSQADISRPLADMPSTKPLLTKEHIRAGERVMQRLAEENEKLSRQVSPNSRQ